MSTAESVIPFNRPFMTGLELSYIAEAHAAGHLAGDGQFSSRCSRWLEERTGAARALLTHSCTGALEMAALLLQLQPGDEIIMPSYTFVSTANAFVLHGGTPVFVDIRPDTMNINENLIESAVTSRTRAICVVHYAGVAAEMSAICKIAERQGLALIEDAAQGLMSSYKGRALGTIGDLGTLSFHETKNIISGEGGALLCRESHFAKRAEILREKGTDRAQFFRGQVDKYTWVDVGSSYLPAELTAAFLYAQMQHADEITQRRLQIWRQYHEWARTYEERGWLKRPTVPLDCTHNGHMYYLVLPSLQLRTDFIQGMRERGVGTVFHYVPLHDSPSGARVGRTCGSMEVTIAAGERLVRMPLWLGVEEHLPRIFESADQVLCSLFMD